MYLGEENSLSKEAMILEWENGHCEALSFFSIGQNFRSYETWYDCTYILGGAPLLVPNHLRWLRRVSTVL